MGLYWYTEVAELGLEPGCSQLPSGTPAAAVHSLERPKWGGGPAPDSTRCNRRLLSVGGVTSCGCARNAGTSEVQRRTQPASGTPLPAPCLLPWARAGVSLWDSLSSCLALLIPSRKRFKTLHRGRLGAPSAVEDAGDTGPGPPVSKIVRARLSQDGKGWD